MKTATATSPSADDISWAIAGARAWKQRPKCSARAHARQQADAESDNGERHALSQDHPQNLAPAGADGHADADLLGPPRGPVRHQTVESNDGQAQPHDSHRGHEACSPR